MTELSQTEYATARGVSASYVSKLKRQGRLVLTASGKVNVEATDRLVENTRDEARGGDRSKKRADPDAPSAATASRSTHSSAGAKTYREAQRREREAKAGQAEIALAEMVGALVRRDEVERRMFGLARQAMDVLLSLDERLAGRLAAETDEFRVAELLRAEGRRIASMIAQASSCDAAHESAATESQQ